MGVDITPLSLLGPSELTSKQSANLILPILN